MNQENQAEYTQVSSFPQDELDEQTSTSDLQSATKTKPFKPIEQAYVKAFFKITRQRTRVDHHYLVLNKALRNKCPPKGLVPNIRHNIPKPPPGFIINWNQALFTTATKLTEILSEYWGNQKEELDIEFERLKTELEEKITLSSDRWLEFTEILDNISSTVLQELKRKKYQKEPQTRIVKQASKVRVMHAPTSETIQAIKLASPNQSTLLYTPDPMPQREPRKQDASSSQPM